STSKNSSLSFTNILCMAFSSVGQVPSHVVPLAGALDHVQLALPLLLRSLSRGVLLIGRHRRPLGLRCLTVVLGRSGFRLGHLGHVVVLANPLHCAQIPLPLLLGTLLHGGFLVRRHLCPLGVGRVPLGPELGRLLRGQGLHGHFVDQSRIVGQRQRGAE